MNPLKKYQSPWPKFTEKIYFIFRRISLDVKVEASCKDAGVLSKVTDTLNAIKHVATYYCIYLFCLEMNGKY